MQTFHREHYRPPPYGLSPGGSDVVRKNAGCKYDNPLDSERLSCPLVAHAWLMANPTNRSQFIGGVPETTSGAQIRTLQGWIQAKRGAQTESASTGSSGKKRRLN